MLPWTEQDATLHGTRPSRNGNHAPAAHGGLSAHGHREAVFDQLGGVRAVEDLVETFYDMIMGDAELSPYFAGFSVARIKQHQMQFLMAVTGGPNVYVGRPLRVAHAALQVSPEHFARMTDHLEAALTVKGTDPEHRVLISARVNALRRHIVATG